MKIQLKSIFTLLTFLMLNQLLIAQTVKKATSTSVKKTSTAVAKKTTKEKVFRVYGNCTMCERAIENSVKHLEGVDHTDWDKETDQFTVSFDSEQVSLNDIKQRLADIGYDTDTHRAKASVYNQLPMCCQYERPKPLKKNKKNKKTKKKKS